MLRASKAISHSFLDCFIIWKLFERWNSNRWRLGFQIEYPSQSTASMTESTLRVIIVLQLLDLRSQADPRMTMLHFIAEYTMERYPDVADLVNDFGDLQNAQRRTCSKNWLSRNIQDTHMLLY